MQASRRLTVFVDFRLTAAHIFAKRWSTEELRHFVRERFEGFAGVLIHELPGYDTISYIPPDLNGGWSVTAREKLPAETLTTDQRLLLIEARRLGKIVLSAPRRLGSLLYFYAALPLLRGQELLGFFVFKFRVDSMIDALFSQRIRDEFSFMIHDAEQPIYRFTPEAMDTDLEGATARASYSFPVHNRVWRLIIAPRKSHVSLSGWRANLSFPLLGFFLAVSLAWLVHLLSRRLEMYREARDQALNEVAERKRAEEALLESEARYRSVFDSATDGLLILNQEGRILEANRAACKMHGYRPGRLVSVMFSDLLTPEHLCDYQEFRRLLALHGRVRLDSESRRQDGSTMDIEVRGSRFSYGNKPHVLAIITDVSERRNAEKRQALLARKALVAQEEERARISRDLHDELGQLLTALRFELDLLHKRIVRSPQDIGDSFIHAAQLVEKAAEELRRICKGLRPPLLDDLGMEPAVRLLVDEFKERTGITVEMEIQFEESQLEVPQEVALCVYRILQESLTNISRHAAARHVNIMLYWRESEFILSVSDDGQGFEINDPSTWKGSGLAGMRERARLVNGSVKIISGNMQGTGIELRVPLSSINVPSSAIKPVSLGTNANSLPEPRL